MKFTPGLPLRHSKYAVSVWTGHSVRKGIDAHNWRILSVFKFQEMQLISNNFLMLRYTSQLIALQYIIHILRMHQFTHTQIQMVSKQKHGTV